jgi:thymidylate synthase ThyX
MMTPTPHPKVTLVGYTAPTFMGDGSLTPLQVIAVIWKQSKTTQTLDEIIAEVRQMDDDALSDLMLAVMSGVPVVEAVTFNFIIENASISWREQMVRHRVGTKPDSRVGVDWQMLDVDDIGDVADLSAWSQSMRLLDMSRFASERRYRTPDPIAALGGGACEEWHWDMVAIERMYAKWAERGVPLEDARDLIPLGATSRLSWTLNLRTLQHIVGKRGCTILQLGLWGPVINGMIHELATKVHPAFRELVKPPCLKSSGEYTGCIFPEDNARRLDGRDHNLPVCPLFIGRDNTLTGIEARAQWESGTIRLADDIKAEAERRTTFWGRDAWTGQRTDNT